MVRLIDPASGAVSGAEALAPPASGIDGRALVLAPGGRDAEIAIQVLSAASIAAERVGSVAGLLEKLREGASAALITEEALATRDLDDLRDWIATQPAWSDMPFIVLTRRGGGLERNPEARRILSALGNASLLERPFHPTVLISAARTARRSRARQYVARDSLVEREARELALATSESHLRFALDAGRLGSWEHRIETGVMTCTDQHLAHLGLPPGSTLNAAMFFERLHPDDHGMVREAIARARADLVPVSTDIRVIWPDGSVHWLEMKRRRLLDADGVVLAGTSMDITARKEAEIELRSVAAELERRVAERTGELAEANRRLIAEAGERERAEARLRQSQKMEAVGQLTGGIAHDFNNLLSAVMGNIELLRARLTEPRATRLADNAMLAVERGAKLTGQLLAFSRMQRLDLAPVDVRAMLDGMRDLLERSLGPVIDLEITVPDGIGTVIADANQLELAVLNLAINARDAMPDGGKLRIGAERVAGEEVPNGARGPREMTAIVVSDSGRGMPAEVRDRAFEPFFTTKEIGKGTGLGLAQVYGIAKQSGGSVTIESSPGAGTTVRLFLPGGGAAAAAAASAHPVQAAAATGTRVKILVVDDDADVRRYLVESLDSLGYQTVEAAHGEAGLAALDAHAPDVMVVDFAMPGMNGASVVAEALRRRPGLPVVFATGYADTSALEGALRAVPMLRKPFRISELAGTIAGALKRR